MPLGALLVDHCVPVSPSAALSALSSLPLPGGNARASNGVSPVEKPALPGELPLLGVELWCVGEWCVLPPPLGTEEPPLGGAAWTAGGFGAAACGPAGAGETFG